MVEKGGVGGWNRICRYKVRWGGILWVRWRRVAWGVVVLCRNGYGMSKMQWYISDFV